jgi:pimeloyl-ACP methyl ester carboxylesterase
MPRVLDLPITTDDGRILLLQEAADPHGTPVLFHSGTPNSRLIFSEHAELATRLGVRLVCYDRPGCGGSTRQPGRTVADCVADVRAIAGALGIERLGVYGGSGGGPHALACAALLGDLVPAVAVLASPAPWGAEGLDFFDGMGELNVEETKLYFADRDAAWEKCQVDRLEMLQATTDQLHESLKSLLSPADAAVLTGDFAEFLADSLRDGLAPGAEGWWDDGVAGMEPWGIELASIRTPVLLLHGRQDRFVPFGHGQWLAAHVPGVEPRLTDEDGHLTLYENHLGEILGWLLERM